MLPIAAKRPTQVYVADSLAILALGALAVSYAAIAALVRNRGSAVATIAALIGGIGAFCGAMVEVLVYTNLAAAATAHLSPAAGAQFLVTTFNSRFSQVFQYVYRLRWTARHHIAPAAPARPSSPGRPSVFPSRTVRISPTAGSRVPGSDSGRCAWIW